MATEILIVEDNPGDARLIEIMLEESDEPFGHRSVRNLASALDALSQQDFDVVLLDLSLPDSHGLETVHNLRQHCADTAVVVLTGVADMEQGMEALQAGAQDYLVKDATNTEVLTRALRYAVGRAEIELAERQQRQLAQALLEIGTLVTSTLDLDEVITRILTSLDMIVMHEQSAFCVIMNNRAEAVYRRQRKHEIERLQAGVPFSVETSPFLNHILVERTIDIAPASKVDVPMPFDPNLMCIGLPIVEHEAVTSILLICVREDQHISEGLQHRLLMFSQQASIALTNAHRFDQSRELAMVKERQRIARDLHDSVTQTLFTTTLMSESALIQWESDPQKSYELQQSVHTLTRAALAEMRVLLLELRPQTLTREPLHKLVDQLVTSVRSSREMDYEVDVTPIPDVDTDVKVALYRIFQEGLNNVIKHAQASKVYIALKQADDGVYMELADDGVGFDVDNASLGMGLKSMQERAREVGAQFEIDTANDEGTVLSITWKQHITDEVE